MAVVDLLDTDNRPDPVGPGDQNGSRHDRPRIGGITQQAPPATLVVLNVEIGSQVDRRHHSAQSPVPEYGLGTTRCVVPGIRATSSRKSACTTP